MTTKIKVSELKNLPKEDLIAIVNQTLKIKEAKKSKTIEYYFQNANDGQSAFHKSKHRIRLMFSGNRGGKSTAGCVETIIRAMGVHPFYKIKTPRKQLVVAMDFENHVKNTLEAKFTQWSPTGAIAKVEKNQNGAWKRIYWSNGSTTDFASQDQDIKVFEGSDYDDCWVDEPCTQNIFNAVWRGLTDRGGCFWMTGTPITQPWLYNKLWLPSQDPNQSLVWSISYSTDLNAQNIGEGDKELGLKRIEEFTSQLSEEEKAARKEGKFLQMQGLIFKEWTRAHHLIKEFVWPAHWPIYESIDPHPQKPWAVSWTGITENGTMILLRSGLFEGVIDEVADQILHEREQISIELDRKPRIVRTIIDNYASVPMMQRSYTDPTAKRKSIREELEAYIGPPKVEVAPKNVRSKIELFKSMLHINNDVAKFYCFDIPTNERFIYEIENYVWDTKRGGLMNGLKDTPRKIDDDILDSIMQVILTLPKQVKEQPEPMKLGGLNNYRM